MRGCGVFIRRQSKRPYVVDVDRVSQNLKTFQSLTRFKHDGTRRVLLTYNQKLQVEAQVGNMAMKRFSNANTVNPCSYCTSVNRRKPNLSFLVPHDN